MIINLLIVVLRVMIDVDSENVEGEDEEIIELTI